MITLFSIITQVIIEILALSLAESYSAIFTSLEVIIAGGQFFLNGRPAHCLIVSEKEINFMKENAIPRNTKHTTKFVITLLKGKM